MRVVGREVLEAFCIRHPDCRKWVANWLVEAGNSKWQTPQDVKDRYASASFLADNVVIFNVRGNEYRMVTHVAYKTGVVAVQWIGTHAEYEKKYC